MAGSERIPLTSVTFMQFGLLGCFLDSFYKASTLDQTQVTDKSGDRC